jgi:hypothetical protein
MNSGIKIKGMTSNAQLGYVFHDIPLMWDIPMRLAQEIIPFTLQTSRRSFSANVINSISKLQHTSFLKLGSH